VKPSAKFLQKSSKTIEDQELKVADSCAKKEEILKKINMQRVKRLSSSTKAIAHASVPESKSVGVTSRQSDPRLSIPYIRRLSL
jgi:hypothetical protein